MAKFLSEAVNYDRQPVTPTALVIIQNADGGSVVAYRDAGPDLCGMRQRAGHTAVAAWIETAAAAGLAIERRNATDPGPDGARQCVLPGTERASDAALARRRALAPLKPRAAQAPCDVGLFSDAGRQIDLCDLLQPGRTKP